MFGFIPPWLMWLSGGYSAKAVIDRLRPPPGAPGSQPGPGPRGVPVPVGGVQAPPPQHAAAPFAPQGFVAEQAPMAPPVRADAKFDPTMDARTEGAVLNCLQRGSAKDLRGFAQSVEAQFPIACWLMRQRALEVEHLAALQAQQAAQQAAAEAAEREHLARQAAAAAAAVPPAPSKANGAAAPAAPVVLPSETAPHPES